MQGFMNSKHVLYPIGYNPIPPNYIFPQLGLSFLFCPLFDSTGGLQQMKSQSWTSSIICLWLIQSHKSHLRRVVSRLPEERACPQAWQLESDLWNLHKGECDSRQLSSGPQPIHTDTLMSSLKTETNLSCIPTCPTRTIFHMYVWVPKKGAPLKDSVQGCRTFAALPEELSLVLNTQITSASNSKYRQNKTPVIFEGTCSHMHIDI